ncbi:hypothetical protein V5R04_05785 [Jonesiaceae bacterium BS-20]|uniref:Uncharacterized protein n=1 Tax=Jonesiaceae bacterium BS-20 TaxID=3120821 RepID=A0AAU7DXK6_9MICO
MANTALSYLNISKELFAVDGTQHGEILLNAREMFIKAAKDSQKNN